MPTYHNSNDYSVTIDLTIIPARGTVESEVFLTPLPAGVTKTADTPSQNPVLYSGYKSASDTVDVPTLVGPYLVQIYVEGGNWEVRFNVASMTPPLVLTEGMEWARKFFARTINSVIFTRLSTSGRIWIQIEKA